MKHKHADLIHAWADGAEIQLFNLSNDEWIDIDNPFWNLHHEYRIKPEEKKPVVRWLWARENTLSRYGMSVLFWTEKEAKENGYTVKLEWSRTEFPE